MTNTIKTKTHTITFWIVITDNMRKFGYRDIKPIFHRPFALDYLDDCREYQAVIPADYIVAQNKTLSYELWDKSHDMAFVSAVVNKKETTLTTVPLYDSGERGTLNHFPIKLIHEKY